jgi:hypothetical protein
MFVACGASAYRRSRRRPDAEALSAAVLDTLATKQDLRELALGDKQDLRDLEFRLTMRLGGMVGVSVATVAALTKLL